MSKTGIGEIIAKYRKAASITQEELGKAVGVSTQAVSRWECGGTPDVELLPAIADKLNVSIDALFSRDGAEALDLHKLLYQNIRQTPEENRMERICNFIFTLQKAAFSAESIDNKTMDDILSSVQAVDRSTVKEPNRIPWQIIMDHDYGIMLYGVAKDMPYALVLPEGPLGYAAMLKKPEEYLRLFKLLSKPHYLDMLIDIYTRVPEENFTDRSAASRLGIPQEEARNILDDLSDHCMVHNMKVADEEGMLKVYRADKSSELVVFLFFCSHMMSSVREPFLQVSLREKPSLNGKPGSGAIIPEWTTIGSMGLKGRKLGYTLT